MTKKNYKKNVFTQRNKNVNIEEIEIGKLYAITLNPEKQDFPAGVMRYNGITAELEKILRPWLGCIEYYLEMEVSKMGRIHYHGVIRFKKESDLYSWYADAIPRIAAKYTFEIDELNDYNVWIDYINKQYTRVGEMYKHGIGNEALKVQLLKKGQEECNAPDLEDHMDAVISHGEDSDGTQDSETSESDSDY